MCRQFLLAVGIQVFYRRLVDRQSLWQNETCALFVKLHLNKGRVQVSSLTVMCI